MSSLSFYPALAPTTVAALADALGCMVRPGRGAAAPIGAVAPPRQAASTDLTLFVPGMDPDDLASSRAGACCLTPEALEYLPPATAALLAADPLSLFRRALEVLRIANLRPRSPESPITAEPETMRHIEDRVVIGQGTVVGGGVEIGSASVLGAHCVIGPRVRIGRDCEIDSHVVLSHCLVGDRVVIGPGVRIGHAELEGGPSLGVPSIGRVIVQSDVAIGANAAVPRGRIDDTVIGEGGVLGSLVHIGPGRTVPRNARIKIGSRGS